MRGQQESSKSKQDQQVETVISGIEDEWVKARLKGNVSYSEDLLHQSYKGVTSAGTSHTKVEFLTFLQKPISSLNLSERSIQAFGDVAVSLGLASSKRGMRIHSYRYLRVYHMAAGKWRLVSSQSTKVPSLCS
jgi:ketosteroid isomerase-like protein